MAPNFLLLDWKWEPQDLFQRIGRALNTREAELLSVEADEVYPAFDVTFSINGEKVSLTIQDEEPNLLFEAINERLGDQQFIDVNFQGDEYAWLLAPKAVDIKEVASLVGYKVIDPIDIKRGGFKTREELQAKPFTEHFDVNQPLATKTLFYPAMYHRKDGVLKKLTFKSAQPGEAQYHFVVEQGQRLHDAMSDILRKDIGYQGAIEMDWVKQAGAESGKSDKGMPSYELQIYLVEDVHQSTTPDGLTMSLEDTSEIY